VADFQQFLDKAYCYFDKSFFDKNLTWDARKMYVGLFSEKICFNQNVTVDGDSFELPTFNNSNGFKMPKIAFLEFERENINIDALLVFIYFCYVADKVKSNTFKVQIPLISKATGLSKTKVKDGVDRLVNDPINLYITETKKNTVHMKSLDMEEELLETFNAFNG
jgi:hypothetical protein